MKVILIDVLQTKEGQRYLHSCGSDTNEKMQTPLKRGPKERQSERRPSAEHSTVRRRASAPRKDQTKVSPLKLTNPPSSKMTNSACAEEKDMYLSKEVQSPAAKRYKRVNNLLKREGQTSFDEEQSCSLNKSDSSPSKGRHDLLPSQTESPDIVDSELCPLEESDSPRPTSVSPVHSEESDTVLISESIITAGHTPSQVKQPSIFHRTEYGDSGSEGDPTQVRFPNNA